jgi:6-pyruvoyltetrahydropterin/6-carboxytetrahydropterin synthase
MFDHTLVIGADDPHLAKFQALAALGLNDVGGVCDIRVVEAVGCEKFAELAYTTMKDILETFQRGEGWELKDQSGKTLKLFGARYPVGAGVKLRSVEVFEHAGNSATYEG